MSPIDAAIIRRKLQRIGLGLAICHRILEEHRGAIQVETAEGHGTIVACFLPVAR